jgi:uncharacterized protein
MAGQFEIFQDHNAEYKFRLTADDGAEIAVSGAYDHKAAAVKAIFAVREHAAAGLVVDLSA